MTVYAVAARHPRPAAAPARLRPRVPGQPGLAGSMLRVQRDAGNRAATRLGEQSTAVPRPQAAKDGAAAAQPRWAPSELEWFGIDLYPVVADQLPTRVVAPVDGHLLRAGLRVVPQFCACHQGRVAYHLAVDAATGRPELVIGPRDLPRFLDSADTYRLFAGAFFGPDGSGPEPWTLARIRAVNEALWGAPGRATAELGNAVVAAVTSPEWWFGEVLGLAAALPALAPGSRLRLRAAGRARAVELPRAPQPGPGHVTVAHPAVRVSLDDLAARVGPGGRIDVEFTLPPRTPVHPNTQPWTMGRAMKLWYEAIGDPRIAPRSVRISRLRGGGPHDYLLTLRLRRR